MATATKTKTETKQPRIAVAKVRGLSAYTQGKAYPYGLKKNNDETHDDFDERMWRERGHYNTSGNLVIPCTAIHKALIAAAKWRSEKIPGQGAKTWTKRFGAGVMALDHFVVEPNVTRETVECDLVHVPVDGTPGGQKRVWRRFPLVPEGWTASMRIVVVDGLIDEDTFFRHLDTAGRFVGIGTHRPSSPSQGGHGRFELLSVEWESI